MEDFIKEIEPTTEKKPVKAPIQLTRFPEIEEKVINAIEAGDIDAVLLYNELTLARNIKNTLSKGDIKQFRVIYVAFKGANGVVKRAGIYNVLELPNSEEAEDIMISEDFYDSRVLAIPRNSMFAEHFL